MAANDELLALADELEGVSLKDDCESCLASGTSLCRGDLECAESAHKACAKRLREIVEHDAGEVTTMSAYDLLPEEDRKAITWVREHGGLEAVKASVHQGAMEHGCLLKVAEMLGTSIYDSSDNADALLEKLSERLMPEGMEWLLDVWPRWSNGEYCRFGDWWTADKYGDYEPKQLRRLAFYTPEQLREWEQDEGDNFGYEWDFMRPSDTTYRPDKAEPPAPKVLDADGVEIRVGDKLYDTETGCGRTVRAINANGTIEFDGHDDRGWFTWFLTHRAPVTAADGKPLREGETVWHVKTGREYVVVEPSYGDTVVVRLAKYEDAEGEQYAPDQLTHERPVMDADGVPIKKGDTVYVAPFDDPLTVRGFAADGRVLMDYHSDDSFGYRPERLTHAKPEPPDTWERLEADAEGGAKDYCAERGLAVDGCAYGQAKAADLVRRAKKLAERGE